MHAESICDRSGLVLGVQLYLVLCFIVIKLVVTETIRFLGVSPSRWLAIGIHASRLDRVRPRLELKDFYYYSTTASTTWAQM